MSISEGEVGEKYGDTKNILIMYIPTIENPHLKKEFRFLVEDRIQKVFPRLVLSWWDDSQFKLTEEETTVTTRLWKGEPFL